MHLTTTSPDLPRLGAPRLWARDLAFVGAVTSLALGAVSPLSLPTVLATAGFAAGGGVALGLLVPRLFGRHVRRVPILILLAAGLGVGACWIGAAGTLGALATGGPWGWTAQIAATAGAAQLGWLWLPMLLGRARGRGSREWVLLACAAAPLIGYLAYQHVVF